MVDKNLMEDSEDEGLNGDTKKYYQQMLKEHTK